MATKSFTDAGANNAIYTLGRAGNGDPFASIEIRTTSGTIETVLLGAVAVTSAITGPERTALLSILGKLYAVGLTQAGFA